MNRGTSIETFDLVPIHAVGMHKVDWILMNHMDNNTPLYWESNDQVDWILMNHEDNNTLVYWESNGQVDWIIMNPSDTIHQCTGNQMTRWTGY